MICVTSKKNVKKFRQFPYSISSTVLMQMRVTYSDIQ
jgi:hypothetical protein